MSNPSNQQGRENQPGSDLIRDFQLPTCFLPDGATQHTVYRVSHPSRHQRPTRTDETWRRQQELGHGSFGCVWLERCASGPAEGGLRAVKGIRKDHSLQVSYSRELEAMAKFSHERYVHCFVKCYGWYESENMVFIAMEYIEHGDLQNYLNQPFSEANAKAIGSQLVEGLGYMHENGFAHRDLKPQNILVYQRSPNWWVKIGDLGICKRAEGTALRTMIGTMDYAAPEVRGFVTDQSPSSSSDAVSYTFAVDMWALGELLFRMIAQRPVFPNWPDLFNHIVNKHPFPVATLKAAGASQDCCNFVTKCMAVDPNLRLTASDAAAHAWMSTWRPPSSSSGRSSPTRGREAPPPITAKVPMWPATPNLQTIVPFEDTARWTTASLELQQTQVELPTTSIRGATAQFDGSQQQPQAIEPRYSVAGTHAQHMRQKLRKLLGSSQNGRVEVAQAPLEKGADNMVADSDGWAPDECHQKMREFVSNGDDIRWVAFCPGGTRWSIVGRSGAYHNHNIPAECHRWMAQLSQNGAKVVRVAFTPSGDGWSVVNNQGTYLNRNIPDECHQMMGELSKAGAKIASVAFPPAGGNSWSITNDKGGYYNRNIPEECHQKMGDLAKGGKIFCVAFPPLGGNSWSIVNDKGDYFNRNIPDECHEMMGELSKAGAKIVSVAFPPAGGNSWSIVNDKGTYYNRNIPEEGR